jgi:hypothetical protein
MSTGQACNAPPQASATQSTAHRDTLRSGSGHQQGAADACEVAQHRGNVHDADKADRQQHAAGAAHSALPQAANGTDPDGLWDSSAHSRPHAPPPPPRAHGHARSFARSLSGLSAGSVPSVDFEQAAQPVASSGFGDHVRLLLCCLPFMLDASCSNTSSIRIDVTAERHMNAWPCAGVHAAADVVP